MENFDEDTSAYADGQEQTEGGGEVKRYPVSRVVVNPDVFAAIRKNSLSDPIKRERWLITRLGDSPSQLSAPGGTTANDTPIFMPGSPDR